MSFISLTFLKKKLIAASRLSKSSMTNTLKPSALNFSWIYVCIFVGFLPVVFISAKPTYPPWQSIILSGKPFIKVDNNFITHTFFVLFRRPLNVRSKSFSLIISFGMLYSLVKNLMLCYYLGEFPTVFKPHIYVSFRCGTHVTV